jgi:N-acetylneuraminic acid mutarotase
MKKTTFCLIILSGLLLTLMMNSCVDEDFVDSPYLNIAFEQKASIPNSGRSSAVGFAINGKGYVALGRTGTRLGFLNDCWEYDPTLNTWAAKADFPGIGRVKAIAAVVDSIAYVGLGFSNNGVYQNVGYLKDFWMFDPKKNVWSQKKDFPGTSTDACVSFVYRNEIYVGAGFDGMAAKSDFWRYTPATDSWTQLSGFTGKARSGAVICTNGERVFFGTGFVNQNLNDWWEYFPTTDSWIKVKSIPDKGRVDAVTLSLNNHFYVSTGRFFGGTLTGGHVMADILEYNATLNIWYQRGSIPNGSRENAISFSIDGKGYIGCGENDNAVLNDFWCFKP